MSPDSDRYLGLARSLAATGRFAIGSQPELERTPGYAVLILPGVLLGHPEIVTVLVQIVLSSATIYLVHRIARAVFDDLRIASTAAWLMAIDPVSVLYSSKILTETAFTFLLLTALLLTARHLTTGSRAPLVWSALSVAAATFVRPVGYVAVVVLTLFYLARALSAAPVRASRVKAAMVFGTVTMIVLAGWHARNWIQTGYSGFSAIPAVSGYFYQGASIIGAESGRPYYEVQRRLGYGNDSAYIAAHPSQAAWPPAARYRWMAGEGRELVRDHPVLYARIHSAGMIRVLLDPGAIEYLRILGAYPERGGLLGTIVDRGLIRTIWALGWDRPVVFWSNLLLGTLLLATLVSAGRTVLERRTWRDARLQALALTAAALWLAAGGPASTNRFRVPISPIICLFAAAAFRGRPQPSGAMPETRLPETQRGREVG